MTFEFFRHVPKENLADIKHDIGRGDNDGNAGNHGHQPLLLPNPKEDGEFRNETGKAGHAHRNKAANDETNGRKRHTLLMPPSSGICRVCERS